MVDFAITNGLFSLMGGVNKTRETADLKAWRVDARKKS
jgi:hypothetical protein